VLIIKPVILFVPLALGLTLVYGQGKPTGKNLADSTPVKVDSLKAAVVTAILRPHMRGDTVEYNTAAIQLQQNAVVEDLLRRLPGLHVDPDGTITYNGQKIQNLLVDGEDIFGSDPTMVTRNFDASKIAKIQILDQRSDQAIFTGIDDGTRTKTINLVMKDDAKNGYFGKIEAGGNTDGYYNVSGAVAGFQGKEQFTALGITANTGGVGYNGGGIGSINSFLDGSPDALGASAGIGIPRLDAAALHYANKWPGPLNHLDANYQYSHYYTKPVNFTETMQIQADSIYDQRQSSQSTNELEHHWLTGVYNWAPDKRSSFRFLFILNNFDGVNIYQSNTSSTFNDTLVNTTQRSIRDQFARFSSRGSIMWRTQLGSKPGRLVSVNVNGGEVEGSTNGYLYGVNRFYQPGGSIESIDTVNQRKKISDQTSKISFGLNYTQPLWKGTVLGSSYGLAYTGDDPLQATYDNADGKYDQLVDSLSNHLTTSIVQQTTTLTIQGKVKGFSYTLGTDWIQYGYRQHDLIADSVMSLRYSNWAPHLLLNYTPSPTINFNFKYTANTQEPAANQLSPIKNNSNPLHIYLGNPDLRPSLTQNFGFNFRRLRDWIVDVESDMTISSNVISTRTITDSLGRQISQPVNVQSGKAIDINVILHKRLLGLELEIHTAGNYAQTFNYVNADLSRNDSYTCEGGFSIERFIEKQYSFQLNTDFGYFNEVSSINISAPVHYWTQKHTGEVKFYFVPEFEIGTNATYTWQGKTAGFPNSTSVLLWNAYVSRNIWHNKLLAKFQFNNILNANAGISRTNAGNVNTQSSSNIIGRYWMLSAIYHFDEKFKKKK
jgi:Outer membrane protein beta-barrel family